MWDLNNRRLFTSVSCGNITRCAFTGIGRSFATTTASGVVKVWEPTSGVSETNSNTNSSNTNTNTSNTTGDTNTNTSSQNHEGDWTCRDLAVHPVACTNLNSNERYLAASFKSGQILRWDHSHG